MQSLVLRGFVCLLVVVGWSCGGAHDTNPVEIGSPAPNFELRSLDGATFAARSFAGQAVVLNFWATWCGPCIGEIPALKQVAARAGAKVIGIALDEGGAKVVRPFVEQHGITYTVLLGDQATFERFSGLGIPYTLVLDRAQRIVKIYRGPVTEEALEQDLKAINQRS